MAEAMEATAATGPLDVRRHVRVCIDLDADVVVTNRAIVTPIVVASNVLHLRSRSPRRRRRAPSSGESSAVGASFSDAGIMLHAVEFVEKNGRRAARRVDRARAKAKKFKQLVLSLSAVAGWPSIPSRIREQMEAEGCAPWQNLAVRDEDYDGWSEGCDTSGSESSCDEEVFVKKLESLRNSLNEYHAQQHPDNLH